MKKKIVKIKIKAKLPKPHDNQEIVIKSTARYRVVACGRRWGKTVVGQIEILEAAFVNAKVSWWLAPTYAMTDHVWAELKNASRDILKRRVYEKDRRITFPGGGSITVRSTHTPDHLRGAGLDFVVLDEAAFMDSAVWPEVVRPMLLDRKGSALFLSSPNGKNWFWNLYQMGVQNKRSWRSFHFTSADNPLLDPAELAAIHAQTPERIWREEYLAEFISDSGQVFRGITEAATAQPQNQAIPEHRYVMGIDLARRQDFTACVVMDITLMPPSIVHVERFQDVSWNLQIGRIKSLAQRFNVVQITVDQTGVGDPIFEQLQRELST